MGAEVEVSEAPFGELLRRHRGVAYATLGSAYVGQGDPAPLREVLALLETHLPEAESAGLPWRRIKALALQALAHDGLGARDRALDALRQALALAEPEGYIRVFADEGVPMAALAGLVLDALPAQQPEGRPSAGFVQRVRAACAGNKNRALGPADRSEWPGDAVNM